MTENSAADVWNVVAVVPTFRPDETLIERLDALSAQVNTVIVVDDGSPLDSREILDRVEPAGYQLVRSTQNRGIAAALNTGVRLALERNADFVLTMDQDSALPADYVAACLRAFALADPATRLGVVCSDRINGEPSIPERYTAEGLGIVREAIQSGFLISAECLRECGLFDERLFIDCVDTEFCLRIAERGYSIAVGPAPTSLTHSGNALRCARSGFRSAGTGSRRATSITGRCDGTSLHATTWISFFATSGSNRGGSSRRSAGRFPPPSRPSSPARSGRGSSSPL